MFIKNIINSAATGFIGLTSRHVLVDGYDQTIDGIDAMALKTYGVFFYNTTKVQMMSL